MFCTKCGNKIDENAKFCNKCGNPVKSVFGRGSNAPFMGEQEFKEPEIKLKQAPVRSKKPILVTLMVLACVVVLGAAGFFSIKIMRENFVSFINETEQKASGYVSLGKYADEYSYLMNESREEEKGYNVIKFIEKRNKLDDLFKNVDELKARVEVQQKKYDEFVNKAEKEKKYILGEYKDKYNDIKEEISKAIENLDEADTESKISEIETLISDIAAYNEKQAKEYDKALTKAAKEKELSAEEKTLIKNSQKAMDEALKSEDYIEAEEVFNKFAKEKKKFDDVRKFKREVLPAYEKYVRENLEKTTDDLDYEYQYALICINDDDIPELFIKENHVLEMYEGVLTYGKEIDAISHSGYSYYIEKENLLRLSDRAYVSYDAIYSIIEGKFVSIANGTFENENGDINFTYYWNEKEVTEDEYNKLLEEAFNRDKEDKNFDECFSPTIREAYRKFKKDKGI